jgi:hypothetical protein
VLSLRGASPSQAGGSSVVRHRLCATGRVQKVRNPPQAELLPQHIFFISWDLFAETAVSRSIDSRNFPIFRVDVRPVQCNSTRFFVSAGAMPRPLFVSSRYGSVCIKGRSSPGGSAARPLSTIPGSSAAELARARIGSCEVRCSPKRYRHRLD